MGRNTSKTEGKPTCDGKKRVKNVRKNNSKIKFGTANFQYMKEGGGTE